MKNTFGKHERLTGKKHIRLLIEEGRQAGDHVVGCRWRAVAEEERFPVRVVFAVPKRKFKRAVDRNLIKRRMKEAYRINKAELIQLMTRREKGLNLMFTYRANEVFDYSLIEEKIVLILQQLTTEHASPD